jgi:hypothetical protein
MLLPTAGKTPASQPSIGLFPGGQTAGRRLQETVTGNYQAKHWRHRTDTRDS